MRFDILTIFPGMLEGPFSESILRRARERVKSLGGAERCNTFSRFYLACLGQVEWSAIPAIPPEIVDAPVEGILADVPATSSRPCRDCHHKKGPA